MTSLEMLREFKLGMDKIDSDSYPEIYNEQIFMFINKAINELVNEGRKIFEKDQTITDNLKSLISPKPVRIIPTKIPDTNEYIFDLSNQGYLFYIRASITTKIGDKTGKAQVKVTQHDDIEVILVDPYNQPKPYKVPITFSRNTIVGYATNDFTLVDMYLTFVKNPAIVSINTSCDIDIQLHYSIVNRAVELAAISLGMMRDKQD